MADSFCIIHLVNQFFGGIGGEDKADYAPTIVPGAKGPGNLLENLFPELSIDATLVVGDNYIATRTDEAIAKIVDLLRSRMDADPETRPQLLLAGPCFNSGRYGLGCAAVCQAVHQEFDLPVLSGMSPENPAVVQFKKDIPIVGTGKDVMNMQQAITAMGKAAKRLLSGEQLLPERDGVIGSGRRKNYFHKKTGAVRAVDMLLTKLSGKPFVTEYQMPLFERVKPAPAVADMQSAKIALVTSGGIVPKGNPDRIEAASAGKYGSYSIAGVDVLAPSDFQTAHGGYDPTYANDDPNRILPLDAVRELKKEGLFGSLHETYYATVGNGTSVEKAQAFGSEVAALLVADGVQAVILTST